MDRYRLQQIADKCSGWIGTLLFLGSLSCGIYYACQAFHGTGSPVVKSIHLMTCLFFGLVTGFLFVRLYLPKIASSLSFGLVMPRRFLDSAPRIRSTYYGMLVSGKFAKAAAELAPEYEKAPGDAELLYLLAQALFALPDRAMEALDRVERFYMNSSIPRITSRVNLKLLFLYADHAAMADRTDFLQKILKQELKQPFYTFPEKTAIRRRLASLEKETL